MDVKRREKEICNMNWGPKQIMEITSFLSKAATGNLVEMI